MHCVLVGVSDVVSNPREVINYCYTYLENHMDADSVSHMMHCRHLISDDNYEAIIAAPNDIKLNTVLLQYVRAMDTHLFMRFCDVLKAIETQKIIGCYLSTYSKYRAVATSKVITLEKSLKYIIATYIVARVNNIQRRECLKLSRAV